MANNSHAYSLKINWDFQNRTKNEAIAYIRSINFLEIFNTRAGLICELRLVKKVCPKIKSLDWGQGRVWRRRVLSNLWWIMNQTTPHSVQYSLPYHLDNDPPNKTIFSYALFVGLHILGPSLYLCLIILPSLVLLNTTNLGKFWIHLPKLLKVPPFCPFPSLVSKIPFSRSNTWSMLTFKHLHKVVYVLKF